MDCLTNAYGVRELGYNDVTSDRGIEGDGNFDGAASNSSSQSNTFKLTIVSNSGCS
jgi:hypothetical protein